jgi:hypothetical protein
VNAVSNSKTEKVLEFFSKMSTELQGQPEWKDWFGVLIIMLKDVAGLNLWKLIAALPYVRNPEESHIFAVYFSRHWQDILLASLHNLLAIIFQVNN